MIDQVKALLVNAPGVPGARRVTDEPSDAVMSLFGVSGDGGAGDCSAVDKLMPIALAPDLSRFRRFYDQRVTPASVSSVYRNAASELSDDGLYDKVLGREGWWRVSALFSHSDPAVYSVLSEMREAASCWDAPYAVGAVLLAVAYRRWILQGGGD